MSRRFEIVEAKGDFSRLTITPSRVTVKIRPSESKEISSKLIEASKNIAQSVNYRYSLRGAFLPDSSIITLRTSQKRDYNLAIFTYDYQGNLIKTKGE